MQLELKGNQDSTLFNFATKSRIICGPRLGKFNAEGAKIKVFRHSRNVEDNLCDQSQDNALIQITKSLTCKILCPTNNRARICFVELSPNIPCPAIFCMAETLVFCICYDGKKCDSSMRSIGGWILPRKVRIHNRGPDMSSKVPTNLLGWKNSWRMNNEGLQ